MTSPLRLPKFFQIVALVEVVGVELLVAEVKKSQWLFDSGAENKTQGCRQSRRHTTP